MNAETLSGQRTWRSGELAEAAGVSVRTLHHYDQLGLLRPSSRSAAGHRLYVASDVRRLHRILALRGFGLPLAEVARVLDGEVTDLRELIQQQLSQVDEQIAVATRLRHRLRGVLGGLDSTREPSPHSLLALMEVMNMNRQLSAEEFDHLAQQRRRWADSMTPEELAEASAARNRATAELSEAEREQLRASRAQLWPENR